MEPVTADHASETAVFDVACASAATVDAADANAKMETTTVEVGDVILLVDFIASDARACRRGRPRGTRAREASACARAGARGARS